jgi:hypothetical protein
MVGTHGSEKLKTKLANFSKRHQQAFSNRTDAHEDNFVGFLSAGLHSSTRNLTNGLGRVQSRNQVDAIYPA